MLNSIRVRLTLWYTLVFGLLLVAFSVFVYAKLANSLYERTDHLQRNALEVVVKVFQQEVAENDEEITTSAEEILNELRLPSVQMAILKGDEVLASTLPSEQLLVLPKARLLSESQRAQATFTTLDEWGEAGARVATYALQADNQNYFILSVVPLVEVRQQLQALRETFYLALPAALLIAGVGGFLLARHSLAPVVAMSNQAAHIGAKNLHERLPIKNPKDELGRLAQVFNQLLVRLKQSFDGLKQFTADASHELRTPIAIIRGEAEVALTQPREASEYRATLAVIADEAARLTRLVDDLLSLTRADAGERPLQIAEIYLNDLLTECCHSAQVLAKPKGITLNLEPTGDTLFQGDEELLRRLILNLLDNAIKYTPSGGAVRVQLAMTAQQIQLIVSDSGVGIAVGQVDKIFDRFYRVDAARSRAAGGYGLGLSIAQWIAEAHQGTIQVTSQPGQGSVFTITLPQ